jgi:uncharacterized ferredoxin-like protein
MSQWVRVDQGILVNMAHVKSADLGQDGRTVYLTDVTGKTWTMVEETEQAAEDFLGALENL